MNNFKNFLKKKFPILKKLRPLFEKIVYGTVLPKLEFHIDNHCNLNCKGCVHFSNLSKPVFIDCDILDKRLFRINSLFGKIKAVKIMGGEPLLHPEIIKILNISRKNMPNTDIILVTNGLLLKKMPDAFFKTCKKNKITVQISLYPAFTGMLEEFKEKISSFNIKVNIIGPVMKFFTVLNSSGTSNLQETFLNCRKKYVILKKDNLYACSISAYIDDYNKKFNKNIPQGQGINIFTNNTEQILKYLNSVPEETCRFCTNDLNYFEWEQSTNPQAQDWEAKNN